MRQSNVFGIFNRKWQRCGRRKGRKVSQSLPTYAIYLTTLSAIDRNDFRSLIASMWIMNKSLCFCCCWNRWHCWYRVKMPSAHSYCCHLYVQFSVFLFDEAKNKWNKHSSKSKTIKWNCVWKKKTSRHATKFAGCVNTADNVQTILSLLIHIFYAELRIKKACERKCMKCNAKM